MLGTKLATTVPEISHTLSSVLKDCHNWMSSNNLQLNINKTKCMLIHQSKRQTRPLNNSQIDQVNSFKLLDALSTTTFHGKTIFNTSPSSINLLRRMSRFLPKKILLMFCTPPLHKTQLYQQVTTTPAIHQLWKEGILNFVSTCNFVRVCNFVSVGNFVSLCNFVSVGNFVSVCNFVRLGNFASVGTL